MIIDRNNISYTSMKEKRKKKKEILGYVLRLKKKVKIYSLGLGSGGAPDPRKRYGQELSTPGLLPYSLSRLGCYKVF
jgi:hypothetical protein